MKERSLIKLLGALETEERKGFLAYLSSPLFTGRKIIAKVVSEIENTIFSEGNQDFSVEDFFFSVFSTNKTGFNEKLLKARLSETKKELLKYLGLREVEKNKTELSLWGLKSINRRNAQNSFSRESKKIRKIIESSGKQAEAKFRNSFELALHEQSSLAFKPPKRPKLIYKEVFDSLDNYFLLLKLKQSCSARVYDRIHGTSHSYLLLPEIVKTIRMDYENHPLLLRIYFQIYQILTLEDNSSSFEILLETILNNTNRIEESEKKTIFKLLYSYCGFQINAGKSSYVKRIGVLFDFAIETGLFFENGKIPPITYKNLISINCRIGTTDSLEKAKRYLEQYSSMIIGDPHQLAYVYNAGVIHFYHEEYEKALEHFQFFYKKQKHLNNPFFLLDARGFLCLSCLELNYWDELEKEISNLSAYIRRMKKYSPEKKRGYRIFYQNMNRLVNAIGKTPDQKKARLIELKEELTEQNQPKFVFNQWIKKWIEKEIK